MPPFQPATALKVYEDDGVVIFSRAQSPEIVPEIVSEIVPEIGKEVAAPATPVPSLVLKHLARSLSHARLAMRAALRKRLRPAQAGGAASEGRAFLGHDSGLRIAGVTCIHRAPQA